MKKVVRAVRRVKFSFEPGITNCLKKVVRKPVGVVRRLGNG